MRKKQESKKICFIDIEKIESKSSVDLISILSQDSFFFFIDIFEMNFFN